MHWHITRGQKYVSDKTSEIKQVERHCTCYKEVERNAVTVQWDTEQHTFSRDHSTLSIRYLKKDDLMTYV